MTTAEITAGRRAAAASRVQLTEQRLAEIRDRIARLQAGGFSTAEDVRRAQLAARFQRIQAERAQLRVLAARADAGQAADRDRAPEAVRGPNGLARAYDRVRDALIATVAAQVPSGPVDDDRRRAILQRVIERSGAADWHGWSQALCEVAAGLMPSVRGVTVIAGVEGLPLPMGATDDWTRDVEELHRTLGEGPALTAHRTGQPVCLDSLASEVTRWPGWVPAARELGVTGVWSFPLVAGGARVGAITFHRCGQPPVASEADDARIVADLAARLLWADADRIERGDADEDLQDYQTVNIAAGMVSVQLDIPIPEAVTRIRAHAFVHDQTITEVAAEVVDRRLRLH
jgi:hypothetical protein